MMFHHVKLLLYSCTTTAMWRKKWTGSPLLPSHSYLFLIQRTFWGFGDDWPNALQRVWFQEAELAGLSFPAEWAWKEDWAWFSATSGQSAGNIHKVSMLLNAFQHWLTLECFSATLAFQQEEWMQNWLDCEQHITKLRPWHFMDHLWTLASTSAMFLQVLLKSKFCWKASAAEKQFKQMWLRSFACVLSCCQCFVFTCCHSYVFFHVVSCCHACCFQFHSCARLCVCCNMCLKQKQECMRVK